MKKIFILLALTLVACSPKESTVSGKFGENAPQKVQIKYADKDTALTVENGTFSLNVPTDKYKGGIIKAGKQRIDFVLDGADLMVDFSEPEVRLHSADPNSLNSKLQALEDSLAIYKAERDAGRKALEEQGASREELVKHSAESSKKSLALRKRVTQENLDNYLGIITLKYSYGGYEDEELLQLMDSMVSELQGDELIKERRAYLAAKSNTAEGKMFVDFEAETATGEKALFSDYVGKGKYVLVDFWASWCYPCQMQFPYLKKAYEKFKGDNFEMLSVVIWDNDAEACLKKAAEHGLEWNQLVNAGNKPGELYGIQGIPFIVLFAPDGTILKREMYGDKIEKNIAECLGK